MSFVRVVAGFLAAIVVVTILATVLQSSFVLLMLANVGAQFSVSEAASMVIADLIGLGPLYGVIMTIGLAVAFLAAALAHRLLPLPRVLAFAGAGAVAIAVMLIAMEQVFFGVQLIAGARSMLGFMSQMVAGGVAGFAFAALTPSGRQSAASSGPGDA